MVKYVVILALFLGACSGPPEEELARVGRGQSAGARVPFNSISAVTAWELMQTNPELVILDTRTRGEILRHGTLVGARPTSLSSVFKNQLDVAHEAPVLLMCAVGGRSYAAGQFMARHGYRQVYNLRGGLAEWKGAGLPVIFPQAR
ncbi:MAG: rhodanese-like domain-containing protein [Thermodesulfobacteriota bacterium]